MEGTKRTVPSNTDPERDTWLASSSLGYFINAKLFMSLNVVLGIPVVLIPEPLNESNISIIPEYSITFLLVFPPLVAQFAKADFANHNMSSMKWLLTAGASIPDNLRQSLSVRFPGVELTLEWGTSETMLLAIQTSNSSTRRPGSSGTLVNGVQARVLSTETGQDLSAGERGELLVRNSLAAFKGYKNNDAANRDFDTDGWFHTGDYGYVDRDCNVYIIDRLKELLRVGDGYGSRVSVSELENAIFGHPAVRSVVVVGVWDSASATSKPTAFVIPIPEYEQKVGALLGDDILASTRNQLTGLKTVSGGVFFLSHYPTTGFKIDRKLLKTIEVDRDGRIVPAFSQNKDSQLVVSSEDTLLDRKKRQDSVVTAEPTVV